MKKLIENKLIMACLFASMPILAAVAGCHLTDPALRATYPTHQDIQTRAIQQNEFIEDQNKEIIEAIKHDRDATSKEHAEMAPEKAEQIAAINDAAISALNQRIMNLETSLEDANERVREFQSVYDDQKKINAAFDEFMANPNRDNYNNLIGILTASGIATLAGVGGSRLGRSREGHKVDILEGKVADLTHKLAVAAGPGADVPSDKA